MRKGGWSCVPITALFLCLSVRGESVGVVKMQDALLATAQMKFAVKELAKQYQHRRTQFVGMQGDLIRLQDPMFCDLCDTQAWAPWMKRIEKLTKDVNRFQADLERDEAASLLTRLDPVRRRMLTVIEAVAKAKGIDLVLDAKPTHAIAPGIDITSEIVAAYNKVHQVY